MSHIRAIFPENESDVIEVLTNHGLELRKALNVEFPKYSVESIAIIPEPLSEKQMKLADNLLSLEFVIDVGKQEKPLNDSNSDTLRLLFLKYCPKLQSINFGIWVREMPSNGFSEHKLIKE